MSARLMIRINQSVGLYDNSRNLPHFVPERVLIRLRKSVKFKFVRKK